MAVLWGFEDIAFDACQGIYVRVASLQNEVGTKYFIRGTNFLTKNISKFVAKCLSLDFVGPKKSRKIPAKFPAIFPSQRSKKITSKLLQERREEDLDGL